MKQFIAVLLAALVVTGIYVVTAGAGQQGVSPSRVARLEKKVTKLQKAVNKIKKQVTQDEGGIVAVLAYSVCNTAVSADALQGTWTNVNDRVSTLPAFTDVTTPVNDFGACQALSVTRQQHPGDLPTTAAFNQLLKLVGPGAATRLRPGDIRQLRAPLR
jgi:hypothetical protein